MKESVAGSGLLAVGFVLMIVMTLTGCISDIGDLIPTRFDERDAQVASEITGKPFPAKTSLTKAESAFAEYMREAERKIEDINRTANGLATSVEDSRFLESVVASFGMESLGTVVNAGAVLGVPIAPPIGGLALALGGYLTGQNRGQKKERVIRDEKEKSFNAALKKREPSPAAPQPEGVDER